MGEELARRPKTIREAKRVPEVELLLDAPSSLADLARFRRTPDWVLAAGGASLRTVRGADGYMPPECSTFLVFDDTLADVKASLRRLAR